MRQWGSMRKQALTKSKHGVWRIDTSGSCRQSWVLSYQLGRKRAMYDGRPEYKTFVSTHLNGNFKHEHQF